MVGTSTRAGGLTRTRPARVRSWARAHSRKESAIRAPEVGASHGRQRAQSRTTDHSPVRLGLGALSGRSQNLWLPISPPARSRCLVVKDRPSTSARRGVPLRLASGTTSASSLLASASVSATAVGLGVGLVRLMPLQQLPARRAPGPAERRRHLRRVGGGGSTTVGDCPPPISSRTPPTRQRLRLPPPSSDS
jgi:hypothetical protein